MSFIDPFKFGEDNNDAAFNNSENMLHLKLSKQIPLFSSSYVTDLYVSIVCNNFIFYFLL